jgi:glycosyltransferase involved in cell wall biosynthesis
LVHPSLSEGGDLFNFSRAASVGVPCLMSDMPVAREMLDRSGHAFDNDKFFFDPFNEISLADKLDEVLTNSSDFIVAQKFAFERLHERSFTNMAKDYYKYYMEM